MCRQFSFCCLKRGFFIERNIMNFGVYSNEAPLVMVMEVCLS